MVYSHPHVDLSDLTQDKKPWRTKLLDLKLKEKSASERTTKQVNPFLSIPETVRN